MQQPQQQVPADLSQAMGMFNNYRESIKPNNNNKKTKEEILAKYFTPRKTSENFRILPVAPNKQFYEEVYFHVVPTLESGGKIRYTTPIYCICKNDPKVPKLGADGQPILQENGQPILVPKTCPLCQKQEAILATQDSSVAFKKREELSPDQQVIFDKNREIFKEANKWEAKKFYIIRGIDRGKEGDGVKFWRFKHNFKQQGVMDKLMPVLEAYVRNQQAHFLSPVDGTDLNIIMAESSFMNKPYMAVSAVIAKGKSPLHHDPAVAQEWLNDPITWRDVFKPRKTKLVDEYEYLQMVVNMANPYYDEGEKRWVYPGRPDLEAKANTRDADLTGGNQQQPNQTFASDIGNDGVTITNITPQNVGTYNDNAIDMGASVQQQPAQQQVQQPPVQPQYQEPAPQQPQYQEPAPQQPQYNQNVEQPVQQQPQQPVQQEVNTQYQQPPVQQTGTQPQPPVQQTGTQPQPPQQQPPVQQQQPAQQQVETPSVEENDYDDLPF